MMNQPVCPVCRKVTAEIFKPFCSERCREVDMGRWLTGAYQIRTDEQPGGENDDRN